MDRELNITVILDRSGSMGHCVESTISGFNQFVNNQKKENPDATLSLVQFDDVIETVYSDVPIKDVELLTTKTFVPRGLTALYDAIGKTLVSKVQYIRRMKRLKSSPKMLIIIITDGYENSSYKYSSKQIMDMIERKKKHKSESWEFLFLGANQDAILSASKVGISASKALNYSVSDEGIAATYRAISDLSTQYSKGGNIEFSDEQRNNALK